MQKVSDNLFPLDKVFIETSVFLRFLTRDDAKKFQDCVNLFEKINTGRIRPYTSNVVIQEIIYVLIRLYKFTKKKVLKDILKIMSLRNLTLIEITDTKVAVNLYNKHNIKYGDCLIALQIPSNIFLVTYDNDFLKIRELKIISPDKFLKSLEVN